MSARLALPLLLLATLVAGPGVASAYSVRWTTAPGPPGTSAWLGTFDDFDGDGQFETMALLVNPEIGIAQLEVRGASTYDLRYTTPFAQRFGLGSGPVVAGAWNLDADPQPEIVVTGIDAATEQGAIRVYEASAGTYQLKWQRVDLAPGFELRSNADLDGDGDLDLLVTHPSTCSFSILDGSTGVVAYTFSYPSCSLPLSTRAVDVNGNGILELIVLDAWPRGWVIESSANLVTAAEGGGYTTRPFALGSAVPNPTRDGAVMTLDLERPDRVEADVLDAQGRRIRRIADAPFPAGHHALRWDGRDAQGRETPSGAYFVEVRMSEGRMTRRIVRLE